MKLLARPPVGIWGEPVTPEYIDGTALRETTSPGGSGAARAVTAKPAHFPHWRRGVIHPSEAAAPMLLDSQGPAPALAACPSSSSALDVSSATTAATGRGGASDPSKRQKDGKVAKSATVHKDAGMITELNSSGKNATG